MQITFEMSPGSQLITPQEFQDFETLIGYTFPDDYRQHMLNYNGGDVEQYNVAHISDPEGGGGIAYFYPIKYGAGYKMEKAHDQITPEIPDGYFSIGTTNGGGGNNYFVK